MNFLSRHNVLFKNDADGKLDKLSSFIDVFDCKLGIRADVSPVSRDVMMERDGHKVAKRVITQ